MKVTIIIDCCNSGGFLPASTPPPGKERITVSSCAADELTYFLAGGIISFSEAFWNGIYSGERVGGAFTLAVNAMNRYHSPQLDDDGNGLYDKDVDGLVAAVTTIGLSTIGGADRPQIGDTISNQVLTDTSNLLLWGG